jgi:polyisoprenoid-binding protein YceI
MFGAGTSEEPEEGYADTSLRRESRLRRATRAARSHWILSSLGVIAALLLAGGLFVWRQVEGVLNVKNVAVSYTVPDAPHMTAGQGEIVYRIDPTQSSVTYAVDENLMGQTAHRAKGSTSGIAGDLAINASNPSASRVGQIVINVEQLHSDNNGRDAQIRQRYLVSEDNPLATFAETGLSGLPPMITEGHRYHFDLTGKLTVKTTTAPVTWKVDATLTNGQLDATAIATVKMSTFGVGPINLAGLVTTSDNVGLTFKFVALDPSKFAVPTTIAAPSSAAHVGKSPSFRQVVAPILEQNCASCHAPGQVGSAHWDLRTAKDASAVAQGLGVVTQARYMPPWPASSAGVPLLHSKALSQHDIDQVTAWAKAGGKLDEPGSTPVKQAKPKRGMAPRQDVVLQVPAPYKSSSTNANDYRCFLFDPRVSTPEFLTGYTMLPQHLFELHHAEIFRVTPAQVQAAKSITGADGQPGWSCYTGTNLPDPSAAHTDGAATADELAAAAGGTGLIASWVPGQDPGVYPQHSGVLFQPGDEIVMQIHYHYDKPPVADQSSVALQFDPPSKGIRPLMVENPVAPVEIPCIAGVSAPLCDRTAALADDARIYGPAGAFVEPGLLGLCGEQASQLVALFKNGVGHTTCNFKVPVSGQIVGVMGHMHTLGKSFRLSLDPGASNNKVLLDIPNWNFGWQMSYTLASPVHVTAGETLQMSCSWDRSLDPNRPPKYIVYAEGTADEMCFSTYAIIPDAKS